MGRPKDPDYWKKWRAAHPEYLERERQRKRKRRPEQRQAERDRARVRTKAKAKTAARTRERNRESSRRWIERNRKKSQEAWRARYKSGTKARVDWNAKRQYRKTQQLAQVHLDRAHEIASEYVRRDNRSELYDDLYEEAVAIAVLSIWEWKNMPEHREKMAHQRVKKFVSQTKSYRVMTFPIDDGLGTVF